MVAFRSIVLGLVLLPAMLAAGPASAATVSDLYETAQPVETTREAAFAEALRTVLVRVSGQRDAPARVGSISDPRKYVQRFGFTADGVLEVGFDSVSIDKLLSDGGLPIWGSERPTTLVMLSVAEPGGSSRWIGTDAPSTEREILARAARQRGLPIKFATMDSSDRAAADNVDDSTALLLTAARYGANAVLVGHNRGGSVSWRLVSGDGAADTVGGVDEGVQFAADNFARVFGASGSSLGNVTVEVSGIGNLDAYAATLNYFEGMTLVKGVSLEQVSRDTLRFRLAVRGDAATLRRAIALDRRLVPIDAGGGGADAAATDRLAFRYQP